jgi:hypothetical protein
MNFSFKYIFGTSKIRVPQVRKTLGTSVLLYTGIHADSNFAPLKIRFYSVNRRAAFSYSTRLVSVAEVLDNISTQN